MPLPDSDKIISKLEKDGVEKVKKRLLIGAYSEHKSPIVREWLSQKKQAEETLEPKAPEIAQKIKWISMHGGKNWKILLIFVVLIALLLIGKLLFHLGK